jgi:tRNA(fMet)-specific endonuclease VapC
VKKTFDILSIINLIDSDTDIAMKAGRLYADLMNHGKQIELNDCFIAATAILSDINLIVTRDTEHFGRIDGIEALTPEDFEEIL